MNNGYGGKKTGEMKRHLL